MNTTKKQVTKTTADNQTATTTKKQVKRDLNGLPIKGTKGIKSNPEFLKALASMETQKATTQAETITADNVQTIGQRIAIRALKTVYTASATEYIRRLYTGLVIDINENKRIQSATYSDGYDIAQTAICFLCEHIGKRLDDIANTGETDKNGNLITIKKACFRAVNRYIMDSRKRYLKQIFLEDNGEYIAIPKNYDFDTVSGLILTETVLKNLSLTDRQQQVLKFRLRGLGVKEIARRLEVTPHAIQKTMQQIQTKIPAEYKEQYIKIGKLKKTIDGGKYSNLKLCFNNQF